MRLRSSSLPRHGNSPAPHNRALRQNQDSRSSVVRPLRRHSKSRPTHHRSGEGRKPSIATLGEKSTQPSPCEAPVKGSVPGGPRPTSFVKHEHRGALKTKTATPPQSRPCRSDQRAPAPSEADRCVRGNTSGPRSRYAISAPQERLHPVAILFAPKKKFRRRSASRPKRDAPPGAGQGVDGLCRSVSNRQRPQSRISPCPSPR